MATAGIADLWNTVGALKGDEWNMREDSCVARKPPVPSRVLLQCGLRSSSTGPRWICISTKQTKRRL